MKKLLFVLSILLVVLTSTQAQKSKNCIQWGLKLGPNFGSWAGKDADVTGDEKKKLRTGFHAGVVAVATLTTMLYLQSELLYSSQGVRYHNGDDKYTYCTNNILLPIALRIQSRSGFYGLIGTQFGFTLGGTEKYKDPTTDEKNKLEDLRSFTPYGIIGAGYKWQSSYGVYLRYARGFSSVFDYKNYDDPKAYYSTLSLSFLYMLSALGGAK